MSKKTKKDEKGVCPECGHKLIYGQIEVEGDRCDYAVRCSNCNYYGLECNDLIFKGYKKR